MPEQLFGIAIGSSLAPPAMAEHLKVVLAAQGYQAPPSTDDREGEYLRIDVLPRIDRGSWVLFGEQPRSRLQLAKDLSRAASIAVDVFEVFGVDSPVRDEDGDLAYRVELSACQVKPDGSLEPPVLFGFDEDDVIWKAQGDFYETVDFVLINSIEGELPPVEGSAERLDLCRSKSPALSPRLEGILANLLEASVVGLETMDGLQFLKLSLPGGSRLVRVSAAELEQLRTSSGGRVP